jgi:hypothetical protein
MLNDYNILQVFLKDFLKDLFFSSTHNDNAYQVMTTALQYINSYKPYTLAGFEPGIFFVL